MKRYSTFAFLLSGLTCGSGILYGQSKTDSEPFPTYNQLKPASPEIIDYGQPPLSKKFIQQKIIFSLFDYPAGTVTYFLNDKKTTDAAYAKEVVSQKGNHITNIEIGQPTTEGKRIISIYFSTDK